MERNIYYTVFKCSDYFEIKIDITDIFSEAFPSHYKLLTVYENGKAQIIDEYIFTKVEDDGEYRIMASFFVLQKQVKGLKKLRFIQYDYGCGNRQMVYYSFPIYFII